MSVRRSLGTRAALVVSLLGLAGFHELRRLVIPGRLHFATNAAMIVVVSFIAFASPLSADELGLSRAALPKGLRYGLVAAGTIGAVVAAAGLLGVDPTKTMRDRAAVDSGEMLFQVFVEIPIATVLLEELAFRGLIAGLFDRLTTPARALAWSSLAFGLWHVSPADFTSASRIGGAMATIAATAVAGAGFHLLKRRSGSLLAPVLAHWGTNGLAFLMSWLILRATN
jgi:membrane protease YdiL (CAAX protease family)